MSRAGVSGSMSVSVVGVANAMLDVLSKEEENAFMVA